MNRYYSSAWGRFGSPDPYRASGGKGDSQSWNRYAYVGGDPANFVDPEGLDRCLVGYSSWWATSGGPPITTPVFGECGAIGAMASWRSGPVNSVAEVDDERGKGQDDKSAANAEKTARRLDVAIGIALNALRDNSDCAALFNLGGGAIDPRLLLTALQSGTSGYGYITLDDITVPLELKGQVIPSQINATTTGRLGGGSAIITFNVNPGTSFNHNDLRSNAITVLHELGHAVADIFGSQYTKIAKDSNSPSVSRDNTKLVEDTCFKQ